MFCAVLRPGCPSELSLALKGALYPVFSFLWPFLLAGWLGVPSKYIHCFLQERSVHCFHGCGSKCALFPRLKLCTEVKVKWILGKLFPEIYHDKSEECQKDKDISREP